MSITTDSLYQKYKSLNTTVNQLVKTIKNMQQDINSRTHISSLQTTEDELKNLISANSTLIQNIEEKLAKINLPSDTRYYLESSEVETFRNNMSKLLAMMADFKRLYKNLVAYSANNS